MRQCRTCRANKDESNFYARRSGRLTSDCKECVKQKVREYATRNRNIILVRQRISETKRRTKLRQEARWAKATGTKRCIECLLEKPVAEFYKHTSHADGLHGQCKECVKAQVRQYNREHAEEIGEKIRAARKENPKRFKAYRIQRLSAHAEDVKAEKQRDYVRHQHRYIIRARQWRTDHPGATWEQLKAWRDKHPLAYKAIKARQAARRRGTERCTFTDADLELLFTNQNGHCWYCADDISSEYHIEHKTPLSRGGMHEKENICLACPSCNQRKHTKTAEEFLATMAEYTY